MIKVIHCRLSFLLFLLLVIPVIAFSQKTDSAMVPVNFGGFVTLTNKGISSIPNLTLGKPAAIVFMSVGNRFRFEPEFRFALNGKPWMFIFWGRYDLVKTDKFLFKVRANPTVVFKTIPATINNVTNEIIRTSRTITADLTTSYFPTKNIGLTTYYMYVYGVEKDAIKNTHYLALRTAFSNIKLTEQFFMGINPSVYYLKMAEYHGFYSNLTMTLAKRNFPLSVSTLINKTIHTQIPVGEDFLWNVSLVYTFNHKYMKQ
jgi:hypothetical protein